jgi:spore germination protein GerM
MPGDAALLSVSQKDGVVTINFSEQFVNVANEYDGGKSAIKSLMLTCAQFEGVKQVKLQVNGKDWEPDAPTMAVPTFVNSEDDVYNYLTD